MRNSLLVFAFLVSLPAIKATPLSNPKLPVVIIKFSPQHMFRSGLWLSAEIFNDQRKVSNQISLEALYSKPVGKSGGIYESSGFTAEYMFRYYPGRLHVQKTMQKEFVKGMYVGMFGQAGSYTQKDRPFVNSAEITTIKNATFYPGFIFGVQQSIGEGFYFDMYFGAGMHISKPTITGPDPNYELQNNNLLYSNGVFPKLGMSFGFGF